MYKQDWTVNVILYNYMYMHTYRCTTRRRRDVVLTTCQRRWTTCLGGCRNTRWFYVITVLEIAFIWIKILSSVTSRSAHIRTKQLLRVRTVSHPNRKVLITSLILVLLPRNYTCSWGNFELLTIIEVGNMFCLIIKENCWAAGGVGIVKESGRAGRGRVVLTSITSFKAACPRVTSTGQMPGLCTVITSHRRHVWFVGHHSTRGRHQCARASIHWNKQANTEVSLANGNA